ncbi:MULTISPECIES: DUF1465 family protein [unclassified Sphingomonas]|uniref:DUF1465 family protein n=1 Tax=unclassified Sphingomonas TaxID=196159 RepID=UPI00285FD020|nr:MULTISPECIES: DUF1465 family protein [unclassified Sphingomonas]MDR6115535.1 regulator of CtrA degradation [Sphingomonas sp. SORGH_AS_0789]MDR6150794.1 regulator of CtrA degradation [Sphingomonas sp. SORGH_AS_0742]
MLCAAFRSQFQSRLIDSLYAEAMLLAESARGYFDEAGRDERGTLDPIARVAFSCESLKVTTRMMHVIAWVLTQRAVEAGEISWAQAREPVRRLGASPESEDAVVASLPTRARMLIHASLDLHRRLDRLDQMADEEPPSTSPVGALHARLDLAF